MAGPLAGGQASVLDPADRGAGPGPVPQVDPGDRGGQLVGVDGGDLQVKAGQGHCVGADAAAEVEHVPHPRSPEALGVLRSHLQAGRLLEPVGGEDHPAGEVAELADGPGAQPRLGQRRGDQVGVEPGGPQP